jgi:hypothetical protein
MSDPQPVAGFEATPGVLPGKFDFDRPLTQPSRGLIGTDSGSR